MVNLLVAILVELKTELKKKDKAINAWPQRKNENNSPISLWKTK